MIRKELNKDVILSAKKFLKSTDAGILSTLTQHEGETYPTGSMCTYVVTNEGNIAILISDIALHTRNIKANNHVSMTIYDTKAKDKQMSARISVNGKARQVESGTSEFEEINEKYLTFFPEAKMFFQIHGFNYYVIEPAMSHFIQGFGKIYTFEGSLLKEEVPSWFSEKKSVIEHINSDHFEALNNFAKSKDISKDVKVVYVDKEGFFVSSGAYEFYYFNFINPALTLEDVKKEFVELLK